MKEGEVKLIKKTCVRHECEECGEQATRKLTYLLDGSRSNPASSAYGKDDCSWCSDAESFGCEAHADKIWHDPPRGMKYCAKFDLAKFPHMGLYWKEEEVNEMLASDFMKQFSNELGA